jgi:2-C-methyl-D-erythritol 4-phosphate cytidylyltransferase
MERFVIIVAGGSGKRMGGGLPKQFIPIGEKPVLMHTMANFEAVYPDIRIIVVLPEKHIKLWKDLCTEFAFNTKQTITKGGETRFDSVSNGLKLVTGDGIVGVHDGVRPFPSRKTIREAYEKAAIHGSAIPVLQLNDSVRRIIKDKSIPVDRSEYRIVQTPQCFRSEILREAYKQKENSTFTDDAAVVEAAGFPVTLTEGNFENIKITHAVDLAFAEVLTKKRFFI